MPPGPLLRVAVPAPVRTLFDYLPADDVRLPAPGVRLRVPFGCGERCGVLVAVAAAAEAPRPLKRITAVLDAEPLLAAVDLDLLAWAARYYQHPIGEVIAAALPLRLRQGRPLIATQPLSGPWLPMADGARFDVRITSDGAVVVDPLNVAAGDSLAAR